MSEWCSRRFQLFTLAVHMTARKLQNVLGTSVTSAIGLLPASNRPTGREAGATQSSADDYAISVMRVIEYMIGPER